jgi:hypothetical protein
MTNDMTKRELRAALAEAVGEALRRRRLMRLGLALCATLAVVSGLVLVAIR